MESLNRLNSTVSALIEPNGRDVVHDDLIELEIVEGVVLLAV